MGNNVRSALAVVREQTDSSETSLCLTTSQLPENHASGLQTPGSSQPRDEKVKVCTTVRSKGNPYCSKVLKHFRTNYILSKGYKEYQWNSGTTPLNSVHMNGGRDKRIFLLKGQTWKP